MPAATGVLQFLQSFPGWFFLRRLEKEETVEMKAAPLIFKEMASMCMCLCVYVFCVLFCHDSSFLFSTKVCSNILS